MQGVGGAGGIVISRSIAADNFKGHELMTVIAITGTINGIAPIVAPMASGAMADISGWQGVFYMLAAVGLLMAIGTYHCVSRCPTVAAQVARSSPLSAFMAPWCAISSIFSMCFTSAPPK